MVWVQVKKTCQRSPELEVPRDRVQHSVLTGGENASDPQVVHRY